jgi:hypothetical protein
MSLLNFVPAFYWFNEAHNLFLEPTVFLDYPENRDTQLLGTSVSIFFI